MNTKNNKLDVIASQIEQLDSEEQVVVIGGKRDQIQKPVEDKNYFQCHCNNYQCGK